MARKKIYKNEKIAIHPCYQGKILALSTEFLRDMFDYNQSRQRIVRGCAVNLPNKYILFAHFVWLVVFENPKQLVAVKNKATV